MFNTKHLISFQRRSINTLILVLFTSQLWADEFSVKLVSQEMMEASLIVKGTLRHSSTDYINALINQPDETPHFSLNTTYTFSVDKVISGEYDSNSISVTVQGGCDMDIGYCEEFNHDHEFKLDKQEVLFLDFDLHSASYRSVQDVSQFESNLKTNISDSAEKNGNINPIAWITGVSCTYLNCWANGHLSYDPDGFITWYSWTSMGGGGISPTVFIQFPWSGVFFIDLRVTDNDNGYGYTNALVQVFSNPASNQDNYDNISVRGYNDDYEGDAEPLLLGESQIHSFHDAGDEDWTMFWSSVPNTLKFTTDLIGSLSDTKVEVYKVTDFIENPSYPGQNRYIINNMELIGSDYSVGASSVTFNTEVDFMYVIKTQSRNNNIGEFTGHSVSLNEVPIDADNYDNVSLRGYSDDYEGDAEGLSAGHTQIHNFHDSSDQDWTMVWSSSVNKYKFSAEMIGPNSSAKIAVYKVTDVIENPQYPGQNRFIINDMQRVRGFSTVGNASMTFTSEAGFLYVMKTESSTNSYGAGTEYRSRLEFVRRL